MNLDVGGLLHFQRETASSIELDRNAKGEYAWKVKVYFDENVTGENTFDVADALTMIGMVDSDLRDLYLAKPQEGA